MKQTIIDNVKRTVLTMKITLIIGSIIFPLLMLYTGRRVSRLHNMYNIAAIIAVLVFGNIASTSIYTVIIEKKVFMTTIHAIFLNPFFLITGAYLGVYVLYRLLIMTVNEYKKPLS